jgi:uncharacterized delta-60 repeat protein
MKKLLLAFSFLFLAVNLSFAQPGTLDTTFNTYDVGTGNGANLGAVYATALQSDGKVIIGGAFYSYNSTSVGRIGRLHADGTLDNSFNTGTGCDNFVWAIAIQNDGKIIIGGDFTTYNGTGRNRIARLNTDGSLDTSFDPGTGADAQVVSIAVQNDGKIIIGGYFTDYNGITQNRLARLNADGSLDITFTTGTGLDDVPDAVNSIAIQSDGKIIIAGFFGDYNGSPINGIARLTANGTLDNTFNPGSGTNDVSSLRIQADGKIIIAGWFTSVNSTPRNGIARLNTDGSVDNFFNPGTGVAGGSSYTKSAVLQNDGKIIIAGDFTSYDATARKNIARVNTDGSLDITFNPGLGANYVVNSISIQNDGKIITGGNFQLYNGVRRNYIVRINTDGSLDLTFDKPTGADFQVYASAVQSDDKIIIGGRFTSFNGIPQGYFARLNADGSLDTAFNYNGAGADYNIWAICLQTDGKIILGGDFGSVNGQTRYRIVRLNSIGTVDVGFSPTSGANDAIKTISIQNDGKIIIGGSFTFYNGSARNRFARVNADGSIDLSYNPTGSGADSYVYASCIQADGKAIIGGWFSMVNGQPRNNIARLNTNGTLDGTFSVGSGANSGVYAVAKQSDGKIIIGGGFTSYNGTGRNRIARLNTNGSLDTTFNPGSGADGSVYAISVQADGKIIIGGVFFNYNGTARNRIARLNSDGSIDTTFNPGSGPSNDIYTTSLQSDERIIIGGHFTSYDGYGKNRVARLNGDNIISVEEINGENNSLILFPNPASDELKIENAELRIKKIEIYNTVGEKVFFQPETNNQQHVTISVADITPGIYFITVTDQAGNKVTKKVVKM